MSAFELWCEKCEVLEKRILSLFVDIFLLGSMSAFSQNSCLSGLDFEDSLF